MYAQLDEVSLNGHNLISPNLYSRNIFGLYHLADDHLTYETFRRQ